MQASPLGDQSLQHKKGKKDMQKKLKNQKANILISMHTQDKMSVVKCNASGKKGNVMLQMTF